MQLLYHVHGRREAAIQIEEVESTQGTQQQHRYLILVCHI
jgi:hypothetical protein